MLILRQIYHIETGAPCAGFTIRNRQNKMIAIGARLAGAGAFLVITHRRYENDFDLVAKCQRLSGLTARHNEGSAAQ